MRVLVGGIGAIGGVVSARLIRAGVPVCLAVRTDAAAEVLKDSGLAVGGYFGG